MGLFDRLKTKTGTIAACVTGEVIPMKNLADPVFAEGILGFCVGIEPREERINAPADGVITQISDTFHALGIQTDEGVELLIHVGLDTVEMAGDGFAVYVEEGERIRGGQLLMTFDKEKITEAGHPATVLTVVTNTDDFASVEQRAEDFARVGEPLLTVAK